MFFILPYTYVGCVRANPLLPPTLSEVVRARNIADRLTKCKKCCVRRDDIKYLQSVLHNVEFALRTEPNRTPSKLHTLKTKFGLIYYYFVGHKSEIRTFWRDRRHRRFGSYVEIEHELPSNEKLMFLMKGGIFTREYTPKGLYIEDGRVFSRLDERNIRNGGNFYKP